MRLLPWDWKAGRQGTGYRKLELVRGRRFDLYFIDYPPGIGIPRHEDPLPAPRRHLRVNVAVLTGGSRLIADSVIARLGERIVVFWSDRPHSVTENALRRFVISLGIAV